MTMRNSKKPVTSRLLIKLIAATFYFVAYSLIAAEKPNIIVILTDDQGYADVGFNGSKEIATPNIDRIANEGVRFTNGYVTYSVCGPSRAGLLTGRYQGRFGFGRNPIVDPNDEKAGLPLNEQMISEVLAPAGYRSGIVGKWHMGTHPQFRPNNRKFDYFYGFLSGGHHYFLELLNIQSIRDAKKDWSWYNTKILENDKPIEVQKYLTDAFSDKAVEFIKNEKDKPFFLYLAYNAPHTPMEATPAYLARNSHIKDKKRRTYAAMLTAVDDGIGRVLDTLDELDVADDTLVFFLSDNGGAESKNASDNGALRGQKSTYFEGGVRVPFAMRWPAKIPAKIDYEQTVSSLDILGTIAGVTQASIAKERPLDGVNLIPYLTEENTSRPHPTLFWRSFDQGTLAMRQDDMKAIDSDKVGQHLYDLSQDLSETRNLKSTQEAQLKKMQEQMQNWENGLIDPVFRSLQGFKKENKKNKKIRRIAMPNGQHNLFTTPRLNSKQ